MNTSECSKIKTFSLDANYVSKTAAALVTNAGPLRPRCPPPPRIPSPYSQKQLGHREDIRSYERRHPWARKPEQRPPNGLKELSNDIIREVLRHQPQHINGFIADYLETMVQVREQARDAGVVISDVLHEGIFFDQLHRIKNVDRKQVNAYATIIQAAWRGFSARKRITEWLQKKKKIEESREVKRELKIEEFLAALGITYNEARRAARTIQSAYKEKRGKWISGEMGEFWVAETVPFGERLKEDDRVQGRYRHWEIEDFGDFFEMDEVGAIQYDWPRIGQLRKVLRDDVPPNVPLVEFFAMRDLEGKEQYSYLIKTPTNDRSHGQPIGFIVPKLKYQQDETEYPEVQFVDQQSDAKMGRFTYVFRDDVKREEVQMYVGILKAGQTDSLLSAEGIGEHEAENSWALPRVLVRIKKDLLQPTQEEMKFLSLQQQTVICEQEEYTFIAETFERSLKIMKHILRNPCLSVEEGLSESGNMKPYKLQETGRIFPVEKFIEPTFIQKIHIPPESSTAEEESVDIMLYNYIFLPSDYRPTKQLPKAESTYSIPIIRFQGYHSDYKGSVEAEEDNKVFIMGPKLPSPDGKPFTYESLFWEEYGIEAWYQLLYNREALENEMAEEEMKPISQETRLESSKADSPKQKGLSESLIPSTATPEAAQSLEPTEIYDQSMELEDKQEKFKTSDEEEEEEMKVEAEEKEERVEKPEKDIKFDMEGQTKEEEVPDMKSEALASSVQNEEVAEEKPKVEQTDEENPDTQENEETQEKAEE